ncbi:hypothetical protein BGX31_010556 [Mortierella sp. GBA43]|nr:hypothetical protein BGX31_010556 [Mortierella sp. GBA43]
MARYPPLHIDIPPSALQARHLEHKDPGSESPGYFRPQHDSGFTFTMSSSQYLASPCSDIVSSPMITPVPCKMQAPYVSASPTNRDDKRGRGGAFDLQTGAKTGSSYQSYLNQSFTQLRQQRLQEQQQQRSKLKTQQSYVSKYSSYTSSSQNMIRSDNIGSVKPSTTQALFMTEKEKLASPYSPCYSSRESLASPPPPYFHPDQRDTLPVDQTPITPALVAPNKRNSLPTPSPSPMSSTLPINPVARNAKELKRHSLPPSSAGLQWPSAMTMAVAAVTRPKLAKTMPPQATPVICGGDSNSSLPLSTPTALFIPRTTRMAEKSEVDTLYSCRISEDEHSTSKSANASGDLCTSNSFNASSQLAAGGSSMRRNGNWNEQQFPGFWQDAKRYRMHWVFYSFALMTLGSIICVAIVPALLVWAAIVPGLATVVLSVQYAPQHTRQL